MVLALSVNSMLSSLSARVLQAPSMAELVLSAAPLVPLRALSVVLLELLRPLSPVDWAVCFSLPRVLIPLLIEFADVKRQFGNLPATFQQTGTDVLAGLSGSMYPFPTLSSQVAY